MEFHLIAVWGVDLFYPTPRFILEIQNPKENNVPPFSLAMGGLGCRFHIFSNCNLVNLAEEVGRCNRMTESQRPEQTPLPVVGWRTESAIM